MTSTPHHLHPTITKYLDLELEERIQKILTPRWLNYPRAVEILEQLENLLNHPKIHRMPNLLITGRTNNGKTMIINRFNEKHPSSDNPNGDMIIRPILTIQAPPGPSEKALYGSLLDELGAPYKKREDILIRQRQVIHLMRTLNIRMLIIDEIQHALAGAATKQRYFLNVIKYLGNELRIPIVGVGIKDAVRAIHSDPQLANRFEPAGLPSWKMDKDFIQLLATYESFFPLKKASNLVKDSIAIQLLAWSEGTIGELNRLLTQAAIYAVKTGIEQINKKVLNSIGWVPPSKRKKEFERFD